MWIEVSINNVLEYGLSCSHYKANDSIIVLGFLKLQILTDLDLILENCLLVNTFTIRELMHATKSY